MANLVTVDHPCPTVDMEYNYQPKIHQERAALKTRTASTAVYTIQPSRKKNLLKAEVEQTDVKVDSSGEPELKQTVDNLNKSFKKQKVIDKL